MGTISEIIALTFLFLCTTILAGHTYFLWKAAYLKNQVTSLRHAKGLFRIQRELVEARFVTYALRHMDANLWLWDEADFGSDVLIARNRKDNTLYAYMPVTVEMNRPVRYLQAKKNKLFLRQVTVTLRFLEESSIWQLTDRTLFNQSPTDIVQRKSGELRFISSLLEHDQKEFIL